MFDCSSVLVGNLWGLEVCLCYVDYARAAGGVFLAYELVVKGRFATRVYPGEQFLRFLAVCYHVEVNFREFKLFFHLRCRVVRMNVVALLRGVLLCTGLSR